MTWWGAVILAVAFPAARWYRMRTMPPDERREFGDSLDSAVVRGQRIAVGLTAPIGGTVLMALSIVRVMRGSWTTTNVVLLGAGFALLVWGFVDAQLLWAEWRRRREVSDT